MHIWPGPPPAICTTIYSDVTVTTSKAVEINLRNVNDSEFKHLWRKDIDNLSESFSVLNISFPGVQSLSSRSDNMPKHLSTPGD